MGRNKCSCLWLTSQFDCSNTAGEDSDGCPIDTDGDGLDDDGEVQFVKRGGMWEITGGLSNPSLADTDADLVSDGHEVRVSGSNPIDPDTDNDGFADLRDPEPTSSNSPISFEAESSEWGQYVRITDVHDGDIASIDVRARYSPPVSDSYWAENKGTLVDVETQVMGKGADGIPEYGWSVRSYGVRLDDEYLLLIEGHGIVDQNPDEYVIDVTDDEGNQFSYRVSFHYNRNTA